MQGWLGLSQREDQSDQYVKQDIRRYVEDLQDMLKTYKTC